MNSDGAVSSQHHDGHDEVPYHTHGVTYQDATIQLQNLTNKNFTPKSIQLSTYTGSDEKYHVSNHANMIHAGKDANGTF